MKKRLLFTLCLAASAAVLLSGCGEKDKYDSARAEMTAGNFSEAYDILADIKDYKDSKDLMQECIAAEKYSDAENLIKAGNYEDAAVLLHDISDYKDANYMLNECIRNMDYKKAEDAYIANDWKTAKELYYQLGGFKDSDEKYEDCRKKLFSEEYDEAIALLFDGKTDEAGRLFADASGYKNSVEMKKICDLISERKYGDAAEMVLSDNCGIPNEKWAEFFSEFLNDCKSIDEYFGAMKAKRVFAETTAPTETLLLEIVENRENGAGMLLDSLEGCGSEAKGKLLAVCKYTDINGKSQIYIDDAFMDIVPNELYPGDLSQVEYVIVTEYKFADDGAYSGTTLRAVRECASVRLMHYPDETLFYDCGIEWGDHSPETFTYNDDPPEYVSGGAPDTSKIAKRVKKALKKLGIDIKADEIADQA